MIDASHENRMIYGPTGLPIRNNEHSYDSATDTTKFFSNKNVAQT